MSSGSAARKRRAQRAKQSSPGATDAPEQPADSGFAALIEPEEEAGGDEDQTPEDEVEDVGEQTTTTPLRRG